MCQAEAQLETESLGQAGEKGVYNFAPFPGNKEVVVVATDYKTYAIMDITSVADAVSRAMKLYSKPSLASSGSGVSPLLCLIVLSGVGIRNNPRATQGREKACDYRNPDT